MTGLEFAGLAGRALHLAALTVLVGAGLAPELRGVPVVQAAGRGDALAVVARRWRRVGALGLILALAVIGAHQAAVFRDPFEPLGGQLAGLLLRTDWGRVYALQVVLAVALLLPALRARSRAVLGLGLASAATLALTGHSWAAAPGRPWVVVADAAHAMAAGVWLGGLLALVAAARLDRAAAEELGGSVDRDGRSFDLAGAVGRFSTLALAAVPVLLLTGAVASWVHGGGPGALLTPGWGRALAVKLAFVVAMALLGLYNWRVTLPALRRRGDDVRFGSGTAAWEALAGVAALVATAVLVALSPPN